MKNTIFILFLLALLLCTSCQAPAAPTPGTESPGESNSESVSESVESETESADVTESNNESLSEISAETGVPSETRAEHEGDIPVMIPFDSIDEIGTFIASANGTAEQYASYAQETEPLINVSQKAARVMAAAMASVDIPRLQEGRACEGFGATYTPDRNELDIIYRVDGIRYRFVYQYGKTDAQLPSTAPVAENQALGDRSVDLYQGDGCLVGYVTEPSAVVQIVVYTEQVEQASLQMFSLHSLDESGAVVS